jgi:MYXO-CTERM domain-containing protein
MKTTGGVLAAAILIGHSMPAAANVIVAVYFPASLFNNAPEATALWAYANPDSGIAGSYAAASADLTAGTFRGFTDLQTPSVVTIAPETGAPTVEANAGFSDFVTFVGTPGQIDVSLTMAIDGDFSAGPLPNGSYADTVVDFVVTLDDGGGGGLASTKAEITRAVYDGGDPKTTIDPGPDGTNIIATLTADDQLIPPVASITTRMTVPVGAVIGVSGHIFLSTTSITPGIETWADFGSTARVTLGYPAGYTFTSQSGVFLSRPDAGGLSLDGGFGGPPDLGGSTSSSTGGTAAGGGTGGGVATGGSASAGAGSGSTGGSAATSGSGTGATPAKSGGCSAGGAGSLIVPVLLLVVLGFAARRRREE